ncbi:MAG: IPT/TIG domain-containing protein [Actinomycetales bacterium]|nr:IPT/TIG domain-containing protein [Actinomycetales bacterium]
MISSKALARKIFVPFLATLMVAGLSAGFASPAKADAVSNTVTIHYQDPAATGFNDYKDWNLWMWKNTAPDTTSSDSINPPLYFNGSDTFGKSYTFTLNDAANITSLGVIVRTNSWDKKTWNAPDGVDNGNRIVPLDADGSTEVWIVAGTDKEAFYTSLADAQAAGAGSAPWEAGAVDPNFECTDGVCLPASTASDTQALTIHYQGLNATGFNSYKGWDVCLFGVGDFACHTFNGEDGYGKVLKINLSGTKYVSAVGVIVRKSDWSTRASCTQCGGDGNGNHMVTFDPAGTTEAWILDGSDGPFFSSLADAQTAGAVAAPWEAGASDPLYACTGTGFDRVCISQITYASSRTLKIHYNRPAGDYGTWNIWMWGTGTNVDNTTLNFDSTDSYGKVATIAIPGDTTQLSGVGFLLRSNTDWSTATKNGLDGNGNQDAVSFTAVQDGGPSGAATTEIWVKQGLKAIYTSNPYGAPTVSSVGLPASIGYGKTFAISGTNFPTDGNLSVSLVKPAVAAVTATKVGSVWKCGSVTRVQGYVCSAAVPAVTAPAVARAISATSAVVSLPQVATGFTGKLVVTTPGGSATSTGSVGLTTVKNIVALPVASPATGVVGDTVTVTATNAGAATSVKLGALSVPFTVTAINKLTFVVPAGAADGKIAITSAAGTSTSVASFALKPSITSVSPASAAINGDITITGVNLSTVTGAKIGTKALVIKSKGATSIVATVPTGAATGKVSVTSPGGTVLSASDLTILPVPTITSITGVKGTGSFANAFISGSTITINGTGLTGATAVRFGAFTVSSFTVVSSTKITFAAPAGKTGTAISVVTPGGTAVKTGAVSTTS